MIRSIVIVAALAIGAAALVLPAREGLVRRLMIRSGPGRRFLTPEGAFFAWLLEPN